MYNDDDCPMSKLASEGVAGVCEELKVAAEDWASANGLLVRNGEGFGTCPVTLVPSAFPRDVYLEAREIAPIFNRLVDRVSRDLSWLLETLSATGAGDDFIKKQMDIMKEVYLNSGVNGGEKVQSAYLGCHRSDYMVHHAPEGEKKVPIFPSARGEPQGRFLQVEFNTIASSFGSLSNKTSLLHRYLCTRHGDLVQRYYKSIGKNIGLPESSSMPNTANIQVLCEGMARAFDHYVGQRGLDRSSCSAYIVFVVSDGERNSVDQRMLEYELWETYGIPVLRRSLTNISASARIDTSSNQEPVLYADQGQKEVAVVYYRDGYSPDAYPTQKEWDARLLIERSYAIKCPSIPYHLVGAKKVQQALAVDGVLEKFLNPEESKRIRQCFAGLYGLTDPAIAAAIESPEHFVLKPQREGGGNNVYGEDIPKVLPKLSQTERDAYILMQRIFPVAQKSLFLLKSGEVKTVQSLSELGIYSAFLGDSTNEYLNKTGGHLLRTKAEGMDEGGVASGYAVIDSPYLVD